MSRSITVSHALGSYPVYVEPGILSRLEQLVEGLLPRRRWALLSDDTVHQLVRSGKFASIEWNGENLTVPAGESSKTRECWARLTDDLLALGFGRDSGLIGLGGGMVGDLTGFIAATYMRGIPYVLAPTTLLAMVDASVGGKTGVNTERGKNVVGAFHPPSAVLADPLALRTLRKKEYREGLAEAVKHGLIADAGYFEWIESNISAILARDPEAVTRLVSRSVEIKAEVVSADERESGRRALLNAGHTVAHALETVSGYRISHGEAVALGLLAECELAAQLGVAAPGLRSRLEALLQRIGLPVRLTDPGEIRRVIEAMSTDKKNRGGKIHCVLIAEVGRIDQHEGWTVPVPEEEMERALHWLGFET